MSLPAWIDREPAQVCHVFWRGAVGEEAGHAHARSLGLRNPMPLQPDVLPCGEVESGSPLLDCPADHNLIDGLPHHDGSRGDMTLGQRSDVHRLYTTTPSIYTFNGRGMENRLVFSRGKQKEFIERAKKESAYTWSGFSTYLETSASTLRDWRNEVLTLPKGVFEIIVTRYSGLSSFRNYIEKELPPNWGSRLAARNTNLKQGNIFKIPRHGVKLSEFIGIL